MKNTFIKWLYFLVVIVLIAKITNWFLHFEPNINNFINVVMFSIIGIFYIIFGFALHHLNAKVTLILCGLFLILMNYMTKTMMVEMVGIICLVIPILIGKFSKVK